MVSLTQRIGSRTASVHRVTARGLAPNARLSAAFGSPCNNDGITAASYATGVARVLESVSCQTVVRVQSTEDMQYVLMGNDLVTETFYSASDIPLFDAVSYNSYRLRSCAQTMGLHMGSGRNHATIVALANPAAEQQQWQRISNREQRAVGVVNVTLMQATTAITAAAHCKPGTPFAMVTNMAVTPGYRRRGIAHQLMQVAIRTALLDMDYTPTFAMLLAYKYYDPAMRLYLSWGFEHTSWQDPLWLSDAEKGKMGRERRVMMIKELSGPGLLATPLTLT